VITQKYKGNFPSSREELLQLPGIGNYTAGAIRNVCFGILTPSLDGNIRRVLSRLLAQHDHLDNFFLKIGKDADSCDFFQAMMELGEQVCLPDPRCALCPVRKFCKAHQNGKIADFPQRKLKRKQEIFHWYLLLVRSNGAHYYVQNLEREFLKHAWIFPDILAKKELSFADVERKFQEIWGIQASGLREQKTLTHTVTFRRIRVHVMVTGHFVFHESNGKWLREKDFQRYPTSSITRKTLEIQNGQAPFAKQSLK
jgi:A/G-specific adenine glycosylase